MKVLFTGDRNWRPEYKRTLTNILRQIKERGDSVIVGDCPTGVDKFVAMWCAIMKVPCHVEKAEWDELGPVAGPRRNAVMVGMKPDICIACHSDYTNSKGTKNCTSQAIKAGITACLVPRNAELILEDYEEYGRPVSTNA